MSAILKQLYDGDIFPAEQFYPKTEEYKAIRKKHFSHYEDFNKKVEAFSPELSKEFVEIMDEQLDTLPTEFSEMFIEGFRLGAKMVIEIYSNDLSDNK